MVLFISLPAPFYLGFSISTTLLSLILITIPISNTLKLNERKGEALSVIASTQMSVQGEFAGKRHELSDICHLWRDLHFKVIATFCNNVRWIL